MKKAGTASVGCGEPRNQPAFQRGRLRQLIKTHEKRGEQQMNDAILQTILTTLATAAMLLFLRRRRRRMAGWC